MAPGARKSNRLMTVVANPILIALLENPLGRRLGRHLAAVEYVGRRSGERHRLVTQYVRAGRTVHVQVGAPDRKTWWRNFQAPHPLQLRLAGELFEATGHVVREGERITVVAVLAEGPS